MKNILFYILLIIPFELISQDIKIGNQIWTVSNLNASHYQNGDPIQLVESSSEWARLKKGAYCIYEGEKLYNWYAVNDPRGIAPKGYHIPSYSEWLELLIYLKVPIGKIGSSGVLKKSGFYTRNSGIRDMLTGKGGKSESSRGFSSWWAYDDFSDSKAYRCVVYENKDAEITSRGAYKGHGFSVRCIKD